MLVFFHILRPHLSPLFLHAGSWPLLATPGPLPHGHSSACIPPTAPIRVTQLKSLLSQLSRHAVLLQPQRGDPGTPVRCPRAQLGALGVLLGRGHQQEPARAVPVSCGRGQVP